MEWSIIWRKLRKCLLNQPKCPEHPQYPHVKTLVLKVINDIISVNENGVIVRSHRTYHEDFIEAERFEIWWKHLISKGSASLIPGDENNPHPWRSCIIGAIFATCLPDIIKVKDKSVIQLIKRNLKSRVAEWREMALSLHAEPFAEDVEESWRWMSREYAERKLGFR